MNPWRAGIALGGVLMIALTFAPWFVGASELPTAFTENPVLRAIGYRSSGDRFVLRVLGALVFAFGTLWALTPGRVLVRPLLVVVAALAAAWSSLPLLDAGTIPQVGSEPGPPVTAGWGPICTLVLSLALLGATVALRPDAAAATSALRLARRAARRGRSAAALSSSQQALRISERVLGVEDAMTTDAAVLYAESLIAEGYTTEAATMLDRLDSRGGAAVAQHVASLRSRLAEVERDQGVAP